MIKHKSIICGILILLTLCPIRIKAQTGSIPRPKLVVGVVVDQMRWDYLYRYYSRYSNGGFKRLLSEGATCANTMIAHIPSYTAVGHTSIYTGSVPSINGITSNEFVDQRTGKVLYCTSDKSVKSVGTDSEEGEESPCNLWVTTIGDELRLATNFHSKVIGISLKDRAAILPAGQSANAAYWFDSKTGHFITSTYYMAKLPEWVNVFNNKGWAKELTSKPWTTLYDIKSYTQSANDDNRYEMPYLKGTKPIFPVDLPRIVKEKGYGALRSLPMGNTLVLEMAKTAIEGEKLGTGDYTDFLAVSCSATDYIGHQFGANAIETEDTYLRLDKDLNDFLNYLDSKIGKGNYTLFLTADHGATNNANFLIDHHIKAGTFDIFGNLAKIDSVLTAKYGVKGLVRNLENYQLNFDYDKIKNSNINLEELKQFSMDYLKTLDNVLFVVDQTKVSSSTLPEHLKTLIANSYNFKRSGEVQFMVKPAYYELWGPDDIKGTTHGIWAPYDLHIPLVFMGWGIKSGQLTREVHMTDIAPTLASLLHIQMPSGCIGHAIPEVLQISTLDK
jgi:hypothetical protein